MFSIRCQETSNVEFGSKLILDPRNERMSLPNKFVEV
jgi:hypothetical protein